MMLKETLADSYHIQEDALDLLFERMERVVFSKKEIIQCEGHMDYFLYFVESGIVRSYIQREDKTLTLWIVTEGGSPLSFSSLTRCGISKIGVQTLTDCVMWRILREELGNLCRESLVISNFVRELAERFLLETEQFFTDYYWRDKREQYTLLLRQCPDLFQRVSLREIASYLSVTPQSLSRIRAERD